VPLVHDRCVCLRKVEYSETSQILTLFGRAHGRVSLIAKGAHRRTKAGASKFDGGVDLLDLGDAVFSHAPERELSPLTEWHLLDGHQGLRRNLRSMHLAVYAAELVNLLIEEHDPHPQLFDRMLMTMLELGTPRVEEVFLSFELDLLREAGYLPELSGCQQCLSMLAEQERTYFSPGRGGVVCRNCEGTTPDRMEIDVRLLRLVRGVLALPRTDGAPQRLPRLTRHQTDPLNQMLARHVEHTLGTRMRMTRWILAPASEAPKAVRASASAFTVS
jgi:DNA repair protein RecO (recombination protein O)